MSGIGECVQASPCEPGVCQYEDRCPSRPPLADRLDAEAVERFELDQAYAEHEIAVMRELREWQESEQLAAAMEYPDGC